MKHQQSSPFQYFLSGAVASTGINVITGVIATTDRTIDGLLLILTGIGIIAIGYLMSYRAAIYDHFEGLLITATAAPLSEGEKQAIEVAHSTKRDEETKTLRMPMLAVAVATVIVILWREYVLDFKH